MTIPNDETRQRIAVGIDAVGTPHELQVDTDGRIVLSEKVELDGIGGVELKDALNNVRARVDDPGTGFEALHVQMPALAAIPAGAGVEGGAAVPAAATTVTVLSGAAAAALAKGLVIQAMHTNTGIVAVGPTNAVNPTVGAEVGAQLLPGDTVSLPYESTDIIWAMSQNGTDRVTWWGG